MSRRSPLATVLRVAELREATARGTVAAAAGLAADARREHRGRVERLAAAAPAGLDLAGTAAVLGWRAAAVTEAATAVEQADALRAHAAAAHTDAARRARLLAGVVEQHRVQQEALRVTAEQRTADDSSTARHLRRRADR